MMVNGVCWVLNDYGGLRTAVAAESPDSIADSAPWL